MGLLDAFVGGSADLDPLTGKPLSEGLMSRETANGLSSVVSALGASMLEGDRYNWFPNFGRNLASAQQRQDIAGQRAALRTILKQANPGLSEDELDKLSMSPEAAKLGLDLMKTKAQAAAGAEASGYMGGLFDGPAPGGGAGAGAGAGGGGRGLGPQASLGDPSANETRFLDTVKTGVTNPIGLAAVAAYGKHESGFSDGNINGTWNDPSESGQPGQAGGAMSWRADRLANMQKATAGAKDPVAAQGQFFLNENPQLIAALNAATTPEEANAAMARAWKFAGWDRPGGENASRLATTRAYASRFARNGQPAQVASADPGFAPQGPTLAPRGMPMPRVAGMDGTAAESEDEVQQAERASGMMPGLPAPRAPGDTRMAMHPPGDSPIMVPGFSGRTWNMAQARAYRDAGGKDGPTVTAIALAQREARKGDPSPEADMPAAGSQSAEFFIPPGGTPNGRVPDLPNNGTNAAIGGDRQGQVQYGGFPLANPQVAQRAIPDITRRLLNPNLPDAIRKQLEWARDRAYETLKPTDRTRQLMEAGYAPGTKEYQEAYKRLVNSDRTPMGYRWKDDETLEAVPGGPSNPANKDREKAPTGYRARSDGQGLEAIPGGPQDPATATALARAKAEGKPREAKPLAQNTLKVLADAGAKVQDFGRFTSTFDDGYAGYGIKGVGGNMLGEAANTMGRNVSGSSYAPQAQYWQDYAQHRNQIRNSLFGSALTATEKAEFDKTDITPGMSPQAIRSNLARNEDLAKKAARRMAAPHLAQGVPVQVLEDALGMNLSDLGITPSAAPQGRGESRATPAPAPRRAEPAAPISPPASAIDYLRANPQFRGDFDAKYGAGAADRVLRAR